MFIFYDKYMGIPWYFYTIYKKYNTENDLTVDEASISKSRIDYLFLDYNSMIHPCAQQTLKNLSDDVRDENDIENEIINDCIDYTRYILNVIKPKYLYIMIDGVAPRAKINQQRERRYKSHFFKILDKRIEMEKDGESDHTKNKVHWNSNKITPGTDFMDKLTKRLNIFKECILNDCGSFLSEVVISDSNIPGEGEHKMMKIISDITNDKQICIYGLDADLIMLSLISSRSDNIVLIRDNTFNSKLSDKDRVYTYVTIKKLKRYVCKDLRSNLERDTLISDENLIYDYIFLCFLLGNDFLEHVPSLLIKEGGINVLLKYYSILINTRKYTGLIRMAKLKGSNTNLQDVINMEMLCDLLYHLSKTEPLFFKNIYSVYKGKKSCYRDTYDLEYINTNANVDIFIYKQDYIRFNESGYKQRYYKFYGITDVIKCCRDYITGLNWIIGYYNNHSHDNWSWYYEHHATPFASDIFEYLKNNRVQNASLTLFNNSIPFSTLDQLLMVLPKDSLLEIMKTTDINLYWKLCRIFNTNSRELLEYYPNNICLDMINKEYLWQSKIFLKQFNCKIINILL
jgi:5'-3' exoribonuclease 2